MNIEHFRQVLQAKQRDLKSEIARLETDARQADAAEVQDSMDQVTSDEGKSESLEESTIDYAILRQVEDALKRIDDGTFGKCIDCGRPISESRLEAVPWTPWCRDDQEKHDREVCRPQNGG